MSTFESTPSSPESVHPQPINGNGHGSNNGHTLNGPLVEPHQDLNEFLETFWMRQMDGVEREEQDGKVNVSLPLARIKKVMKSDEEVKVGLWCPLSEHCAAGLRMIVSTPDRFC